MTPEPQQKRSRLGRFVRVVATSVVVFVVMIGTGFLLHPESNLSRGWNPLHPLSVSDPVTPLTSWKLARVIANPEQCLRVLQTAAQSTTLPAVEGPDPACGIENTVMLAGVGQAAMRPLQTSCAIALRTAMWEHHGLQPLAQDIFGSRLTQIDQIGSYNCRRMRTASGAQNRWSTHATAQAIDVTGFRFADGRRLRLIDDWHGTDAGAAFLKRARDTSSDWFRLTLSPDYNRLHADHFHLQSTGWGACR